MPTSNLIDWMDEVDPYAIQRLAVVKGMFIATIMVFVYWVFRPLSFSAYIIPAILIYYYESPALKTTKEKGKFSIFIFTAFMIGNITFYLIFPFKIIFFYYAILFFAFLYYLLDIYYNQLKTAAMLILAYSLFTLSDTPPANFQVVYTLFFSSMLSIITMLICLRIYPMSVAGSEGMGRTGGVGVVIGGEGTVGVFGSVVVVSVAAMIPSVVTTPAGVTLRMAALPESTT